MNEPLVLDRYRLIERLAVGGSAEVWRAQDEQLDRPVAVKRLHAHLMPDDASRRRLAAEARSAAGLSHPVIVGIYDVDATGESPSLVMELVEGESLAARIERDGPLPPREAASIAAEVADALFHAHQRGVIHRDVKPGNVLLANDGRVRLVDFGIAHSLAEASERLTMTGTVIGTLRAMAPEQLAGGQIGPRTDLYGIGVVLHEALTGRPPYPMSSPVALAEAQRAGPPDLAGIDPALAALMATCLAHDPTERPLHAGALATALRDWLAGDDATALAMAPAAPADTAAITRPVPVVPPPVVAAAPESRAPESRAPASRAPRWRAIAAGVAALVVLVAIGFVLAGVNGGAVPAGVEETPSPSPPPTAVPTASPVPEWLAKRVEDVETECGAEIAAQAAAEMAAMSEDQAKDYAEELADACKEAGGGDGNGRGNGRGNDD